MTDIVLDASVWRNRDDLYAELLPALGAPSWHGWNLDALNDSFRADDVLRVERPVQIYIQNTTACSPELRDYLAKFASLIADLQNSGSLNISLNLS